MRGCMQINIMSRLQYAMTIADTDKSGGLDFFEFIFLMFMMTQKGTYIDMVSSTHSTSASVAHSNVMRAKPCRLRMRRA